MSETPSEPSADPLERDVPPLDAVDSRWWYWIAAYPVVSLLLFPVLAIVAFATFSTAFVVGSGMEPGPGPGMGFAFVGVAFGFLVFALFLLSLVVFLLLPAALYMDARAVARAGLDWTPDPLVYAVAGLLQFVVTPVVGLVVALYYLYRRHEHVGVP